jgi:hypothetical protein
MERLEGVCAGKLVWIGVAGYVLAAGMVAGYAGFGIADMLARE